MSARERRPASEEERALFYETLADVKPLRPRTMPKTKAKAKPTPKPRAASHPARTVKPNMPSRAATKVERDEPPAIGGHRAVRVRRGRAEPEARLDLHGLTQEAAHRMLLRFLYRARANDARLVLVITGKSGILNRHLKPWLAQGELGSLVAGVSPAHARHGGGGAWYVLLRKSAARR